MGKYTINGQLFNASLLKDNTKCRKPPNLPCTRPLNYNDYMPPVHTHIHGEEPDNFRPEAD